MNWLEVRSSLGASRNNFKMIGKTRASNKVLTYAVKTKTTNMSAVEAQTPSAGGSGTGDESDGKDGFFQNTAAVVSVFVVIPLAVLLLLALAGWLRRVVSRSVSFPHAQDACCARRFLCVRTSVRVCERVHVCVHACT